MGKEGWGGGYHGGTSRHVSSSMYIVLACLLVNGRREPPSLLIDLFEWMRREHKEFGKTLKTSPHVQFTFIVWTCALALRLSEHHLCPEYKRILIPGERLASDEKRQKTDGCWRDGDHL